MLNEYAALGSIAEISGGWTTSATSSEDGLDLVRTTDIADGEISWSRLPQCSTEPPDPSQYLLRNGDVLVARTGVGSVGNVAVVRDAQRAVFASYLLRLRPRDGWNGVYLRYYLASPAGRRSLEERALGATIPNLSTARLSTVPVPVATPSTQDSIATHLSGVDADIRNALLELESARTGLASIRRRVLEFVPSWRDSGSSRKTSIALPELLDFQDNLRRPVNAQNRAKISGSVPYYGASGVIDHVNGFTHEGDYLLVSEDGNNLRSRKTPIAFSARGRFWANNHVHVLSPRGDVNLDFLVLLLESLDFDRDLTGTAQPKLSKSALDRLRLDVPALELQHRIVAEATDIQNSWRALDESLIELNEQLTGAWDLHLRRLFSNVADQSERGDALKANLSDAFVRLDEVGRSLPVEIPKVAVSSSNRSEYASVTMSGSHETLRELLDTAAGPRPVEDLFDQIDWRGRSLVDAIDDFYGQVKAGIAAGWLIEERRADGRSELRLS